MTDREIAERIAHDVAVESGMAHESLSALTAVVQEGIDRAVGEKIAEREAFGWGVVSDEGILVRTISDTRRAALVNWLMTKGGTMVYQSTRDDEIEHWWLKLRPPGTEVIQLRVTPLAATIRARTAPDPQSEIGLRAHLADLAARGLKP